MRISIKCKDDFARLLSFGITALIACQAIVNFFVVTGLGPATGVPLPFISYGGSSTVINLAAIGVVLNVASQINDGNKIGGKKISSKAVDIIKRHRK